MKEGRNGTSSYLERIKIESPPSPPHHTTLPMRGEWDGSPPQMFTGPTPLALPHLLATQRAALLGFTNPRAFFSQAALMASLANSRQASDNLPTTLSSGMMPFNGMWGKHQLPPQSPPSSTTVTTSIQPSESRRKHQPQSPDMSSGGGEHLVSSTLPSSRASPNHSPSSTNGTDPPSANGRGRKTDHSGREKVFLCKICNRSFGYKHVLQNHERTHTGEKPFECKECHKRFTRDHHLKTHMRLHTGEKPYSCTHCDRQFVQVANLRRHLRVHTGEKPYHCEICDARFSDSNQLKAHALIHRGEKPFECGRCFGKFRRRHHLHNHKCGEFGTEMSEFDQHPLLIEARPPSSEVSHESPPPRMYSPMEEAEESESIEGEEVGMVLGEKRRERKQRETRKIVRSVGLPQFYPTTPGSGLVSRSAPLPDPNDFRSPMVDGLPEQTEPEDLSINRSGGSHRSEEDSERSGLSVFEEQEGAYLLSEVGRRRNSLLDTIAMRHRRASGVSDYSEDGGSFSEDEAVLVQRVGVGVSPSSDPLGAVTVSVERRPPPPANGKIVRERKPPFLVS